MNFRPSFSVRTLLVLVTLAGLYFGSWEATKRLGVVSSGERGEWFYLAPNAFDSSPGPFVISRENYRELPRPTPPGPIALTSQLRVFLQVREYHFWFFGFTAKLPFERELGTVTLPPPRATMW